MQTVPSKIQDIDPVEYRGRFIDKFSQYSFSPNKNLFSMGKHKKVMKMRDFKNNLSPELRDTEYTNGLRCSKGEIRYIVSNGDI